jgi:tRNA(Ile)-lysidine synthase
VLAPFLTFLNQHNLLEKRLLLAVSGGMDSVVLAELAHRANLDFGVAHANFGLRGAESDGDEAFVKTLAERYGRSFFSKKFDTSAFAQTHGLSVQLAARKLRYAWFDELLDAHGFDALLTAHHRDDALETLLLNLVRGAGLAGLAGIPARNGRVVRPLLAVGRADIARFAAENNLAWREDRSNATDDYPRNFLRHRVLPRLRELNPNLTDTAAQTLDQLAAARRLLEHAAATLRREAWRAAGETVFLDLEPLRQSPEPLLLLHELLRPLGFRYRQSAAAWAAADGQPGKTFFSPTHALTVDRARLVITPRRVVSEGDFWIENPAGTLRTPDFGLSFAIAATPAFGENPAVADLDFDRLTFPLHLRRWQPGDWFYPLGMNGKRKKISDLLVDLKVPRPLKARVWVLVSGDDVAWVVGHRLDERFRVTDATRRVWRAEEV